MTLSNREQIGRGLELMATGLKPFVGRQLTSARGDDWLAGFQRRDAEKFGGNRTFSLDDPRFLLRVVTEERQAFTDVLSQASLSVASDLRTLGNRYAHEFDAEAFTDAETRQALESMARLLTAAGATAEADAVRGIPQGTAPTPPGTPGTEPRPDGFGPFGPAPTRPMTGGPGPFDPAPGGPGPYGPYERPAARRSGSPAKPLLGIGLGCGGVAFFVIAVLILVGVFSDDSSSSGGSTSSPHAGSSHTAGDHGTGDDSGSGSGGSANPTHQRSVKKAGSYTNIELARDYTIDFRHPKHPVKMENDQEHGLTYNTVVLKSQKMTIVHAGQPSTYAACRDTTRYTDEVNIDDAVGHRICMTNDDGFTALAEVKKYVREPSEYVVVDLKLWRRG